MRRVKTAVPIEEAIRRALRYLDSRPRLYLAKASEVACEIWPDEVFLRGQGAGGAASRILRRAEKAGLAHWTRADGHWGWKLLPAGRAFLLEGRAGPTEPANEARVQPVRDKDPEVPRVELSHPR